jgi:hypothetical protein
MPKLLVATLLLTATTFAAGAQTTSPPAASGPAASDRAVSAATHCRDANGRIRLKSEAMGGSPTDTTGSATTSRTDSGISSSTVNPSGMPQTGAAPSLPAC